jgi:hypothetical protein
MNSLREIEFRGKRKDNGEWVYGDLAHDVFSGAPIIAVKEKVCYGDYISVDIYVVPETAGSTPGSRMMPER